jgi:hypothetical protein
VYRLYYILGRVRLSRALSAVCLTSAVAAWVGACTVNEPRTSKAGCLAGEPCVDAAVETQSEVLVGPDAHVEPAPSGGEAGLTALCPTECNPEDVQTCAQVRFQQVRLDTSADGGASGLGAGVGAEVGAGLGAALDQSQGSDASLVAIDDSGSIGAPALSDTRGALDGGLDVDFGVTTGESLMSIASDADRDAGLDAGGRGGGDAGRGQLDVLDAAAGSGPGSTPSVLACQLVERAGEIAAECAQSGSGSEGAACASARDCAPGLGCVGYGGSGQCLPYCCGGNDSCGEGRYCTQRPLRSLDITNEATAPTIPVCAVADNCSLMLGPCTDPGACSCPAGLACTIVRASTTACVSPGSGSEGESCPCAPGYFCSQGTNTCLKFCNTQDPASNCGNRECQPGPSGFPMGWGLCVGD